MLNKNNSALRRELSPDACFSFAGTGVGVELAGVHFGRYLLK